MTDQDWREILELHRRRGCPYDGRDYRTHTCANATRGKIVDRAPLPEYIPANIQPDAAIVDPDGITF